MISEILYEVTVTGSTERRDSNPYCLSHIKLKVDNACHCIQAVSLIIMNRIA